MSVFEEVKKELSLCFCAQMQATADWHVNEPEELEAESNGLEGLKGLVLAQHSKNFKLWHVEDIARRKDVGPEVIADCKYRIDGFNQRRNDYMERIDACLVEVMLPHIPRTENARMNSESLGMSVDRLSILSLKIFHMEEQTNRTDVGEEHIRNCTEKLAVLKEQREDLCRAVLELVDDYAEGVKVPKVYFQCKMYNDPSLNPQLYAKKS